MDYLAAFGISANGMAIERLRLDVAAANLAQMNTPAAKGAQAYQPRRVMAEAIELQQAGSALDAGLAGVRLTGVESISLPPRLVKDPGNPAADEKGFVSYPAVDHLTEMTSVMSALRAYEANVAALNAAKSMAAKALEIGGQ